MNFPVVCVCDGEIGYATRFPTEQEATAFKLGFVRGAGQYAGCVMVFSSHEEADDACCHSDLLVEIDRELQKLSV